MSFQILSGDSVDVENRTGAKNAQVLAGKMPAHGVQGVGRTTGGLKSGLKLQQSVTTNERRILSDISNTKAPPHASFGTPKPSPRPGFVPFRENTTKVDNAFKSENLYHLKAGPPPSSQKPAVRIPLRSIVNESQTAPTAKESGLGGVKQKQKPKIANQRKVGVGYNPRIPLTEEQEQLAQEWAKEDIHLEKISFTGDDMEALRQKLIDEEIEEHVKMVRSYRGDWFPSLIKPSVVDEEEEKHIRNEDGSLKLDHRSNPFDESGYPVSTRNDLVSQSNSGPLLEDPVFTSLNSSDDLDEAYPCFPENWHVLRDECVSSSV